MTVVGLYDGMAVATPQMGQELVRLLCRPWRTIAQAEQAATLLWEDGWMVSYPPQPLRRGRGDWVIASVHTPDEECACLGDITSQEPPA